MIFYIADCHFGHDNIIRFCDRPFKNADQMDQAMIQNWNSSVTDQDTVFILGDMFFRSKNEEEIVSQLKGKKRLIVGNHDQDWMGKFKLDHYFESIDNFLEIKDEGRHITLCHYPLLSWNHFTDGYLIYGHIHNQTWLDFWPYILARDNMYNAGAEINDYRPVTFDQLKENNERFKRANPEGQTPIFHS